jgi:hypothetical protein
MINALELPLLVRLGIREWPSQQWKPWFQASGGHETVTRVGGLPPSPPLLCGLVDARNAVGFPP